jgi:Flp pilus assembly protein TadG
MQFALMAVPLCVCTGLAIDGGRAFLARFELASALDAAALAVGSTIEEDADLDAVARKFVDMNFKTQHDEPVSLELVTDDESAVLRGEVTINTFFMPLIGQPYVTVSAESEVRRGGNSVEVALALDVTGSMAGTRIVGLQEAAKVLIDEVVSTQQSPYFSKAAIVPWSQSVYVGTTHADATVPVELRGTTIGSQAISGASWRKSGTSTQTISSAGWRTNTGRSISNATWKNGSAFTISNSTGITKTNSNTRIRVRLTANPGYANGDTVVITGANGSYTSLNGNMYKVADRTTVSPWYIWLQNVGTTTYTTPPAGSTNGTAGSVQRCLYTDCVMRVTASSHAFATGALVYINGVNGTGTSAAPAGSPANASVNNSWGTTWNVTNRDSNNFTLNGTYGPNFVNYSSSGTASECYVSDCRYRVVTSANHSLSASDDIFIWGVTETGGGTSLLTSANSSINPDSPATNVFYMPGNGNSYKTWSSGGSVAACANSSCNVDVTANSHGLASGERVEITGVVGLTGLNSVSGRRTWGITKLSDNSYRLVDSTPALSNMSGNYSSGGASQCLTYGCAKLFPSTGSSASTSPYLPTDCLVERYGSDAATDVSPATSPLGMYYSSNGTCASSNYVTPLTADRARLTASIDALQTGGSTAGQIGIAWAWYMLSPNFNGVFDKEVANAAKTYDTKELVKVAVLMTDGEFNYSTCKGLSSGTLCSATNTYTQAQAICTAMKAQKIVIYTVGLELTDTNATDFLTNCASSPAYAHLAADVDELKVAFRKISASISKLRLSK